MGVLPVERHRVERCRETLGRHPCGQVMEPAVGLLRWALAGKHPGRVLFRPLEGEDPGGVRKLTGDVLLEQPAEPVTPGPVTGQRHLRHPGVAQRLLVEGNPDLTPPHVVDELCARVLGEHGLPTLEGPAVLRIEILPGLGDQFLERSPLHACGGTPPFRGEMRSRAPSSRYRVSAISDCSAAQES